MPRRSIVKWLRVVGVMTVGLIWAAGAARADLYYSASYHYDSSIQVGITYSGQSTTQYTSPVRFDVTPTNSSFSPIGPSFIGFCIDLWHDEYNPTNFKASAVTSNLASAVVPAGVTPTVTDPQLTNVLSYLGTVFAAMNPSNNDQMGALQLAIWHLIDKNFTVTSWPSDTTLYNDYKAITGFNGSTYSGGLLGGVSTSAITGSSIGGYNSGLVYSGAQVLVLNQSFQSGQNVISWQHGITISSIAPEPSSLVIGGLGALGFIGYSLRRRFRSSVR